MNTETLLLLGQPAPIATPGQDVEEGDEQSRVGDSSSSNKHLYHVLYGGDGVPPPHLKARWDTDDVDEKEVVGDKHEKKFKKHIKKTETKQMMEVEEAKKIGRILLGCKQGDSQHDERVKHFQRAIAKILFVYICPHPLFPIRIYQNRTYNVIKQS